MSMGIECLDVALRKVEVDVDEMARPYPGDMHALPVWLHSKLLIRHFSDAYLFP